MLIRCYKNFQKRANSTKIPSTTDQYTSYEVYMKESTSVENPTFLLDVIDMDVNYINWNSSWYYVVDITLNINGIYELSCTQDHLATYRSRILNSSQYILYAGSRVDGDESYFNKLIPDRRLPKLNNSLTRYEVSTTPVITDLSSALDDGHYMIRVSNTDGLSILYFLTKAQFLVFSRELLTLEEDVIGSIVLDFNSVIESIAELRYIPLAAYQLASMRGYVASPSIKIGSYTFRGTNAAASIPVDSYAQYSYITSVSLPYAPPDWRNAECTCELFLPQVGLVPINISKVIDKKDILVKAVVAPGSARITYSIYSTPAAGSEVTPNYLIATYDGELGFQLPLVLLQNGAPDAFKGLISGVLATATTAATGGLSSGLTALTGFNSLISNADNIAKVSPSMIGSAGSPGSILLGRYIAVYVSYQPYAYEPATYTATIGRPLYKVDKIGDYSGYVQTLGASISLEGLANERNAINQALDSGIYVE